MKRDVVHFWYFRKASLAGSLICINHEYFFIRRWVVICHLVSLIVWNSLRLSLNNEHILLFSVLFFFLCLPYIPPSKISFFASSFIVHYSLVIRSFRWKNVTPILRCGASASFRGCSSPLFPLFVVGIFLIQANPLRLAVFPLRIPLYGRLFRALEMSEATVTMNTRSDELSCRQN